MNSRLVLLGLGLVVTALVVADVLLWPRAHQHDAVDEARVEALGEARTRIPDLLGYSYKTLDADLARANTNTTGQFHDDYAKVLAEVVAPHATPQKTITHVKVDDAAVVSGDEDRVVVLAFLTQATTSAGGTPMLSGSRVEVTLEPVDGQWLISGLLPL
jgi:Mce-associated membrane protein